MRSGSRWAQLQNQRLLAKESPFLVGLTGKTDYRDGSAGRVVVSHSGHRAIPRTVRHLT